MNAPAFDNSYARLPKRFFARTKPATGGDPRLVKVNRDLAAHLGFDPDWLASPAGVAILAGRTVPDGAEPIALAYAGHQFGHFVPRLGDGRAVLLGEVIDRDGRRRDMQLKGAGLTAFSRGGDGRAALGPVLREYLISEAMAALGIPTTRALAAVTTGEPVVRETLLPGAILTRVASSHIRVGTFQFFAAQGDVEGLRVLADHVIQRHYPEARASDRPYRAMLDGVIARQADLIAHWLLVGFVHGVMNTDNMSIAGETIDYGPCAFLDAYDPGTVFSSIDQRGRYAYASQPQMSHWNLTRLAEALLPLLSDNENDAVTEAQEALAAFAPRFEATYQGGLRRKIGLASERDGDKALAVDLLKAMAENKADFTLTFRLLCDAPTGGRGGELEGSRLDADEPLRRLFTEPDAFDLWATRWRDRLAAEPCEAASRAAAMRAVNPAFIPRNYHVEAMIAAAVDRNDFAPFEELLSVLTRPYDDQPIMARYAEPPEPGGPLYRTFCGT